MEHGFTQKIMQIDKYELYNSENPYDVLKTMLYSSKIGTFKINIQRYRNYLFISSPFSSQFRTVYNSFYTTLTSQVPSILCPSFSDFLAGYIEFWIRIFIIVYIFIRDSIATDAFFNASFCLYSVDLSVISFPFTIL